jgi:hypothetical protein
MLIPVWLPLSRKSVSGKTPRRPVAIEVVDLRKHTHGEVLELTTTQAKIKPNSSIFIFKSMRIKIEFRSSDIVYCLTGASTASASDNSFYLEFDEVTRERIPELSKQLGSAGYEFTELPESKKQAKNSASAAEEAQNAALTVEEKKKRARKVRYEKPPGGVERRVHTRHEADVAAILTLVGTDTVIECTVVEISLSGCRLSFDTPHALTPQTIVEIHFVKLRVPLRLAAKIQTVNSEYSIGLKFGVIPARTKEQLNLLIWDLANQNATSVQQEA